MAELRSEQDGLKQEQHNALAALEDKYQKQIDSLQGHLQRVVADNQAKDDTIQQVGTLLVIVYIFIACEWIIN